MAKKFQVGDTFDSVCIFTGGCHQYTVNEIEQKGKTKNLICHSVYNEIDGIHKVKETFKVYKDEQNNEYIVLWQYKGEEGRHYAQGKQ